MTRPSFRGYWTTARVLAAVAAVCLVSCIAILQAGCGTRNDDSRNPVQLRIGIGTGGSGRAEGIQTLAQLLSLEPLLSFSWEGQPVFRLAESADWEQGGLALRLRIRHGITFHNGHPVTATAVAAAIKGGIQDDAKRLGSTAIGFEHLLGVETPSSSEVLLRFSAPDNFALNGLADLAIFDRADRLIEKAEFGVGAGPFVVKSLGSPVKTERYPRYYQGSPGIDEVELVSYDSQRAAWGALMRREVSMLQSVSADSAEFLERTSDVRTFSSVRAFYVLLGFNLRHPVLANPAVRRGLTEAIDRERIASSVFRGRAQVGNDPIWPFHWAIRGAAAGQHLYDTQAAQARLEAAGFSIRNNGAKQEIPSRLRFKCLFWSEEPQHERIALMVQRDLAQIGVDMILEPISNRMELQSRLGRGDFEAFVFQANSGRGFDRLYQQWHSSKPGSPSMIETGYNGADQALERLRGMLSESETRLAVAELKERFYEDVPAIVLVWPEAIRAADRQFRILEPSNPDIFTYVGQWRRESPALASK